MGFYNFTDGIWACGFQTRSHGRDGNVAYISHSGSGMCGIVDTDERIAFNLVVSTGQELAVAMDDYLDFALEQPSTRVVGLFMETARNPEGLVRALEKARARRIPVVALKVGRTELSAKLAVSHSGAIAGQDASYQALFDRYGVQRVDDMDQLATALIMFAQPHSTGRRRARDPARLRRRAAAPDRPRARRGRAAHAPLGLRRRPGSSRCSTRGCRQSIRSTPGARAGPDYHVGMQQCFAALMADPGAALGAVVHDRVAGGVIHDSYLEYLRIGHAASGKPAFLVSNRQGTGADPLVVSATRAGFPVLDGMSSFLRGVKCLLDFRDFANREHATVRRGCPTRRSPPRAPASRQVRAWTSTRRCSCCATAACPRIRPAS